MRERLIDFKRTGKFYRAHHMGDPQRIVLTVLLLFGLGRVGGACYVFLTSEKYTADLGGLGGAVAICEAHAAASGLAHIASAGAWRPWLTGADLDSAPARTFVRSTVPYRLPDGTPIALDWDDLVDGTLLAPVNQHENGTDPATVSGAWTGTGVDGERQTWDLNNACSGWTSTLSVNRGARGSKYSMRDSWTTNSAQTCNSNLYGLYCVQQDC